MNQTEKYLAERMKATYSALFFNLLGSGHKSPATMENYHMALAEIKEADEMHELQDMPGPLKAVYLNLYSLVNEENWCRTFGKDYSAKLYRLSYDSQAKILKCIMTEIEKSKKGENEWTAKQ